MSCRTSDPAWIDYDGPPGGKSRRSQQCSRPRAWPEEKKQRMLKLRYCPAIVLKVYFTPDRDYMVVYLHQRLYCRRPLIAHRVDDNTE